MCNRSISYCLAYYLFDISIWRLQLLEEKGLLPELSPQIENIECALDSGLQGAAAKVATIRREKGQSVDLVLEGKALKLYLLPCCSCFQIYQSLWF